jgi:subtilisin family serine protease
MTPATRLPKLDPRLAVSAFRAAREQRLAPAPERGTARARPGRPRRGVVYAPRSLRGVPIGLQSIRAQLSPTSLRDLEARDVVPVLVESVGESGRSTVAAGVTQLAAEAHRVSRTTVVARVARNRLADMAALAGVRRVEASVRLRPLVDLAHASAMLFHGGARSVSQTGAGVLVGIVDTGIDAAHPGFQAGGQTRIVRYVDQTTGAAYSPAQINAGAAAASPDEDGHGTHVAGIAAGGGGGLPVQRYAGVAPGADLAVVKTTFDTADIASGVALLFDLAAQRNQPCVVNLSLGGHWGGHDGSSLLERAIDELCEAPGRAVVVSAGNEGGSRLHAGTRLVHGAATPQRWVADLELSPRVVQGTTMGLLWVSVWTQREDDLVVTLRSPNGELFRPPLGGRQEADRSKFAVDVSHQVAAYSGDNEFSFGLFAVAEQAWLRGWSLIVEEDRSQGRRGAQVGAVHAWIADEAMGAFVNGYTRTHLVGMPGTAYSAVTVASYATRKTWESQDPSQPVVDLAAVNLEDISYFSSPGPTREEQNKPEVAAPGQWLISALSAQASVDAMPLWIRLQGAPYAALQGTSMSAPYVAGALALLLEKEPTLHWGEMKRRLAKSCRADRFTTPCWNERWGHGKIDVERLLTIDPNA